MNRHITITEAKKLCPNLIMQHVATWKEGDEKWAYHKDAFENITTHKVSLDPYRLESRRILACIKDVLPAPPVQKVEKASVDEVFLDLSTQIHCILLERYPELSGPAPYDDPTENLPRPPTTALDWNTDALVDLDSTETEDDDPDWDDIVMLIGSEIVRSVRAAIRERLKYTCSAGIARNKMLAKLGSGHKKPNQQTIVRNRAIQQFLSGFKFTKIRNLGGKLGDQIVSAFSTDEVGELLKAPIEQLKSKIGDDSGTWVYQTIRGDDYAEVNSRTQIKSMLSAKSFRPSINSFEQAVRWLRIFAADIFSRLIEEGVLENKRRPKTINLHHRQGGQMRSRQAPIPSGRAIDEPLVFDIAKTLLGQIIIDGRAWPCANLQLSVGGFEEGPSGNRGIGGFLVKGEEAKAMRPSVRESDLQNLTSEDSRPEKRRRIDDGGIQKFFAKRDDSRDEPNDDDDLAGFFNDHATTTSPPDLNISSPPLNDPNKGGLVIPDQTTLSTSNSNINTTPLVTPNSAYKSPSSYPAPISDNNNYLCPQCNHSIPLSEKSEHEDWHFAKDLQDLDRPPSTSLGSVTSSGKSSAKAIAIAGGSHRNSSTVKTPEIVKTKRGPKKPGGLGTLMSRNPGASEKGDGGKGVEKGQRRLAFG